MPRVLTLGIRELSTRNRQYTYLYEQSTWKLFLGQTAASESATTSGTSQSPVLRSRKRRNVEGGDVPG